MKKIVIIHGIGGLERESYFPHLKKTCEELGLKVFMPSLGGYKDSITYEQWRDYLNKNILPLIDEDTIFVGQSLGTQFLVKYIVEKNLNLKAYISCAGFCDFSISSAPSERTAKLAPIAKLFKPTKQEYELFKSKQFKKYSFFSDDDIFFNLQSLQNYADAIGAHSIFIKGKGHFNYDAKVFEFTELESLVKKLI